MDANPPARICQRELPTSSKVTTANRTSKLRRSHTCSIFVKASCPLQKCASSSSAPPHRVSTYEEQSTIYSRAGTSDKDRSSANALPERSCCPVGNPLLLVFPLARKTGVCASKAVRAQTTPHHQQIINIRCFITDDLIRLYLSNSVDNIDGSACMAPQSAREKSICRLTKPPEKAGMYNLQDRLYMQERW